jgi:hypothetical protein
MFETLNSHDACNKSSPGGSMTQTQPTSIPFTHGIKSVNQDLVEIENPDFLEVGTIRLQRASIELCLEKFNVKELVVLDEYSHTFWDSSFPTKALSLQALKAEVACRFKSRSSFKSVAVGWTVILD